jgi:hypothetical protein
VERWEGGEREGVRGSLADDAIPVPLLVPGVCLGRVTRWSPQAPTKRCEWPVSCGWCMQAVFLASVLIPTRKRASPATLSDTVFACWLISGLVIGLDAVTGGQTVL